MSGSVVEKRYAKALFEIASKKKLLRKTEKELALIEKVIKDSPDIANWLNHPSTRQKEQKEIFANSFSKFSLHVRNLLFVLIDKKRLAHFSGILACYRAFSDGELGLAKAKVTSSMPLTKGEREQLSRTFGRIVGKKLIIEQKVDSNLLGGAVVQIGDRLFDGSLRTKLQRFREKLSEV